MGLSPRKVLDVEETTMKAIRNVLAVVMFLVAGFAYAGAPVQIDQGPTDQVAHCPPECK